MITSPAFLFGLAQQAAASSPEGVYVTLQWVAGILFTVVVTLLTILLNSFRGDVKDLRSTLVAISDDMKNSVRELRGAVNNNGAKIIDNSTRLARFETEMMAQKDLTRALIREAVGDLKEEVRKMIREIVADLHHDQR